MPTHITAVINQKGGAGKTTLSMNLAAGLSRRGDTVIVDLDPQGSARQWASLGTAPFPATVKQMAPGKWDAKTLHQTFKA
ncbi:MAG: cobyrinic acid a,c-diamide synthase, partial [Hydrogenophilales bacterium 17-61-9]